MMDISGPFLLVLIFSGYGRGGVAVHEFPSQADCRAAIVQLDPVRGLLGYCIAARVVKEAGEDEG